jgi:hypothetical protein
MPTKSIYLDSLPPLEAQVGYGQLGTAGALGYEDQQVSVLGKPYPHALSAHAPARLLYKIDGRFRTFKSLVALNGDVPAGVSSADFTVRADGKLVAAGLGVVSGEPPRPISADVSSAQSLELTINTSQWNYCHSVWLDPKLVPAARGEKTQSERDCLERADITLPDGMPKAERCIATIASRGFESLLDDMLGSLAANGGCPEALLVVFVAGDPTSVAPVAAKYRARLIHCEPRAPIGISLKSVLYSVARVVDAEQFLCLDADMLVLGDLRPVFAMLDACPESAILAVREHNGRGFQNLGEAFRHIYLGNPTEAATLLADDVAAYSLVVNDGLFAGSRAALLSLDSAIQAMPELRVWMDSRPDVGWRNQFVFNAALARSGCGVELDSIYNLQLNGRDIGISRVAGRPQAEWKGKRVRVLHFNGDGRSRQAEWRGRYARVPDPLGGPSYPDWYGSFLNALRAWTGIHGLGAMAWSFYGTPDGRNAHVSDAALPLLGLLHHLIRANGCVRVFETGTARGVSGACLASAVAHRAGARVVSFDPCSYPERAELWAALPDALRSCLEPRQVGSLEGMAAAIANGESYEAALLDSVHTAEHVSAEFELAQRLVCRGGLILVHDAQCAAGTVEPALAHIQSCGYGVVRLWTAEGGIPEDSRLGLAVIENRRSGSGCAEA